MPPAPLRRPATEAGAAPFTPATVEQRVIDAFPSPAELWSRLRAAQGITDDKAAEQLLPLVYDELRKLAAAKMAQEKPGQTLQATALVHEAYIRLVDNEKVQPWDCRAHFYAAAAEAMRRILVEQAQQKGNQHGD